ncbi:hypothetical protein C8A05DRAFT_45411 [Staphylotrichum tortipilum]|uniref:Aminoglycoside phosphotransferase domain-containing protein n=1 Tax=Staphylotrichum tortipilum TaxID=2831512 RepID=A0AAN6RST3_9PEZI|nr:hypothetical protein C8A05DRAFT_45411 [Staphylotrichum longicolle]
MVRRINFDDGVSCVIWLRLPDDDVFGGSEALTGAMATEIEIASMKFFRSKTSIPVPKLLDCSTATDNPVGAPYMLVEYIYGTVASELREARSCPLQMSGTSEQDRRFREQMAQIQATVATFQFSKIGSLYHNPETDEFHFGPDLQIGKGPWTSFSKYYDDLADHLLKLASAKDVLEQSQSFMLPVILNRLMGALGEEKAGPFRLTNLGVIDLDGVMAAPLEVAVQYPVLSFLETEPPGFVPTKPAMIDRIRRTEPKLREYRELLAEAELGQQGSTVVANRLGSRSAGIYREMVAYAQHQDLRSVDVASWVVGGELRALRAKEVRGTVFGTLVGRGMERWGGEGLGLLS